MSSHWLFGLVLEKNVVPKRNLIQRGYALLYRFRTDNEH